MEWGNKPIRRVIEKPGQLPGFFYISYFIQRQGSTLNLLRQLNIILIIF